jgi:1-acyl-sn-glycerol-3-phosphate acyltransferase
MAKQERNPEIIRFLYRVIQTFVRILFRILFGLKIEGRENVPKSGSLILATNHKSWFDPPIAGSCCPREIYFAAKKDLFSIPIIGTIIRYLNSIPIRRSGSDKEAILKLIKALKDGYGIIIFPEGTRFSDDILHTAKPGIGLIAVRSEATIVPTYISGSNRLLEQIWRRKLRIIFGKPFSISNLNLDNKTGKTAYRSMTSAIMQNIAQTGGVSPPSDK